MTGINPFYSKTKRMKKNIKNAKTIQAGNGSVKKESYGTQFLKKQAMACRGEKSIYIRPEYHERIARIVHVIGDDKIPLYAYLDNILKHHFEQFEQATTKDFNEKFKPIF